MLRRVLVLFTLINFLFSFNSISQTENLDQNFISEKTIVVYSLLNKETESNAFENALVQFKDKSLVNYEKFNNLP